MGKKYVLLSIFRSGENAAMNWNYDSERLYDIMKKMTSILLGLILAASVALAGCRLETELETNIVDDGSSTAMESGTAPGKEIKPVNADESESVSNVVTEPTVSQNKNEIGTNQPGETVSNLKITAEGVPVEVRLTGDGQYSYEYNKDVYAVMTTTNGSTFEIKVTDIRPEVHSGDQTNVVVYIPNQSYTLITGVSEGSSLILPAINANITVTSNASSVIITLPPDYNKTLNYTGNASSCSLFMSDNNDFAVSAKISTSAVSVPSNWPAYDMLSSNYNYTGGNGTAKINIDVTSGSFIFE